MLLSDCTGVFSLMTDRSCSLLGKLVMESSREEMKPTFRLGQGADWQLSLFRGSQ